MAKRKTKSTAMVPAGDDVPAQIVGADLAEHLEQVLGRKVKIVKNVTLPVLRQHDGVPIAVQFDSEIKQAVKLANDDSERQPPKIANVIDLQTGELCTLICNAARVSALERMYPDEKYVGKQFAMVSRKRPHKGERTIREYAIREIEV